MAKKRGIKIIARIVEAIAVILVAGLLALHLPAVQNKIALKATEKLNETLGSKLSFSGIRFVPFRTLVLEKVAVVEQDRPMADTLLYADRLSATFSLKGLLKVRKDGQGGVWLDRLRTEGLVFIYVLFDEDEDGYTCNLTRAFGIPEDKERYPKALPDLFTIGRVDLRNSRVKMLLKNSDLDYSYTGVGINWSDVDLIIPTARLRGMKYVGGRFSMDIDEISATDKCGYTLNASGQMSTGYNEGADRLGHHPSK